MRLALFAFSICALAMTPAFAQDAARFDGNWNATISCSAQGDTKLYRMDFPANVRGGQLSGEHGTAGQGGWVQISGQIKPNGSAYVLVNGLAGGNVNQAVGRVATGTPYKWHADTHFDGTVGQGLRTDNVRPCMIRFVR